MKKVIGKYFLEFLVIVLGISISFYLEKRNAINYKEELKNEALKKLKNNIDQDIYDHQFNLVQHQMAFNAGQQIVSRGNELYDTNLDSLGYYLVAAGKLQTIFVDNTEEYNALKNSGLIELIDNDKLVLLLQQKYSMHLFIKEIEKIITTWTFKMVDLVDSKTALENKKKFKGQPIYWSPYKKDEPFLTHLEQNTLFSKSGFHEIYSGIIKRSIRRDSIVLKEIDKELER